MSTTQTPGAGFRPGRARRRRRAAVIGGAVLAITAIAAPFGVRGLDDDDAHASAATPTPPPSTVGHHRHSGGSAGAALGPQGDLPPLLSADSVGVRAGLQDGARVRIGDITDGSVRRTPGGWQVVVRWDGRRQPLRLHGPVSLGRTSWVSADGLLYTRAPAARPGHFRVYAWDPQGGSAYSPPSLVAVDLGQVCFNRAFTAYGNCRAKG